MTLLIDRDPGSCGVAGSGTIELYVYGELTPAERDGFDQHLARCAECRGALEELSLIGAALDARPAVAAPPGGEWRTFMAGLDAAIDQERVAALDARDAGTATGVPTRRIAAWSPTGSPSPDRQSSQASGARGSYTGYIAMAALLALVTINIAFVMRSRGTMVWTAPSAGHHAPAPATDDIAAFEALSEEHFERSKLVVLGLATKDADHAQAGDWTYERRLAASLLSDTRMYRLAAEDRGLQPLAGVLRDLELVLLQTSLTDETDPASLGQIQRLIGKRDLLQKMDAVATTGL
ncbi:MAG: zf-HC2 domain-containing protein [Acidobacteriota bacterium]